MLSATMRDRSPIFLSRFRMGMTNLLINRECCGNWTTRPMSPMDITPISPMASSTSAAGDGAMRQRCSGLLGNETSFKNNIDHTIQNGRIEPSLLVVLSYNNTSG